MGDHITTYSGIHMLPLAPRPEEIRIRDIAHALSLMVRANGHFPVFYSVGQHCIHCCEEAYERGYSERVQLACLLHDASEAYLADITRPVKQYLPQYRAIEKKLQDAVFQKYLGDLSEKETELWRELDNTLLYYEFQHFMKEKLMECRGELKSTPVFDMEPFQTTEKKYLDWFERLYKG
ncbi:MAG: HD domain-containing protein [Lachnospiraceae bacterium]|nr:HD domain-containing protein [Lachnospiraceae bacterium]